MTFGVDFPPFEHERRDPGHRAWPGSHVQCPVFAVWPVTAVSYKIEPDLRPVAQFMPKRQSGHIYHSIEAIIGNDIEDFTNVTPVMGNHREYIKKIIQPDHSKPCMTS